jgi:hypothetical protein
MNIENLEEDQINLLIVMEEFRYWDASRNQVPKLKLEEIKLTIKKMKKIRVASKLGKTCAN